VKDFGQRKGKLTPQMPGEKKSLYQPDEKKSHQKYEGGINILIKPLAERQGSPRWYELQQQDDKDKNKGKDQTGKERSGYLPLRNQRLHYD
jgi:hypothetical protein